MAGLLATRAPRLAYPAVDALAAATGSWRNISRDEIARAFPHLSPGEAEAAARAAWKTHLRNQARAVAMRRAGMQYLRDLVDVDRELTALRPPLIIAGFHMGARMAPIYPVVEQLPGDVLAFRAGGSARLPFAKPRNMTFEPVVEDEQGRARALYHALRALSQGAFVFIALDAVQSAHVEAQALGGTLRLARGAFVLARRAGVPIVPVAGRWEGARIRVTRGEAIGPGDEEVMAASAARWLDGYLGEHPGDVSPHLLSLVS